MLVIPVSEVLVPVAIAGLIIAAVLCAVGVFYSGYQENWLQFAGMVGIALAAVLKAQQLQVRGVVTPETALLAVSVALFALGMAVKVWRHRHPPPPKPPAGKSARRARFTAPGH